LKVLIGGNEYVELRGGEAKKLAVLDSRPVHLGYGSYGMTGQCLA
jgi:hypothetical protein